MYRTVVNRRALILVVTLSLGPAAASAFGQDAPANPPPASGQVVQKPEGPPPTPAHTGIRATLKNLGKDFLHVPSRTNAFWAGVGGGLALAVHPADRDVNARLAGLGPFFTPGKYLGAYTLWATTATIYAVGRVSDKPKVSHLGMDLVRALTVDEVLTQVIKHSVHRERPDGSDNLSFPSGHASSTFAFATALERHLGWRGAVPAYLIASYVAISRLHENRHYLSDVVFGAAVGIIAGRTSTRHPRNDYSMFIAPTRGGAQVFVTLHPQLRGY